MKKALLFVIAFSVCSVCFSQAKYTRKHSGFAAVAYSEQQYIALSKNNEIFVYPVNSETLSVKLSESSRADINSLFFRKEGTEIVSVSENGISIWNFTNKVRIANWEVQKTILASTLVDNKHVAFITDSELHVFDIDEGKTIFTKSKHGKFIRCVASSADGKFIVTGGGDNSVIIQDAVTGETTNQYAVHTNLVRAVDISPDGLLIASGDDGGAVLVTDLTGVIKFMFSQAKGWVRSIKFSPDNKYLAFGDEYGNVFVYSLENGLLTEKYNVGSSPVTALVFSPEGKELSLVNSIVTKAVKSVDVSKLQIASAYHLKDQKDNTPPQIYVSSPQNIQDDKTRVYTDMIDIRGTLMDESGIRNLRVNGKDVPLKENNNFVIHLPLAMGDNAVVIEAKDINDNISVKRFTVQRKNMTGEEYSAAKATNYLFVVGINDYEHFPRLNNAVKDANDIANALLKQYSFEFDNLVMLKNEQATRSNIYKSLRSLIEQVTPQDNLLIYFSGHGYFDGRLNEGYWIPVDAELNNSGDYLSNSDLLKIIGNIDSQHTFLIADACFSGSLFSESKRGYAENVERFKSRWGLASGRLETVSDGAIGKNSPFATATLTFLNDNKKDKVAISELIQYVKLKVSETSDQTPLGNPLKVNGDEGGEMVLYKRKN